MRKPASPRPHASGPHCIAEDVDDIQHSEWAAGNSVATGTSLKSGEAEETADDKTAALRYSGQKDAAKSRPDIDTALMREWS